MFFFFFFLSIGSDSEESLSSGDSDDDEDDEESDDSSNKTPGRSKSFTSRTPSGGSKSCTPKTPSGVKTPSGTKKNRKQQEDAVDMVIMLQVPEGNMEMFSMFLFSYSMLPIIIKIKLGHRRFFTGKKARILLQLKLKVCSLIDIWFIEICCIFIERHVDR